MTFTVKYRAIDGKMREECIEAASRAECVSKCKAQGIAPISVKEGGKVSNAETQQKRKIDGKLLWIIAGVVILGGVLWWVFGRQNEVTVKAEKPKAVKQVKQVKSKAKPQPATNAPAIKAKSKAPKVKPQRVGEIRDGFRLLADGTLHKVVGVITNTPGKFSLADKTFKYSADVELGNLLMVEPGDDLLGDSAGMYRGFGKELDEALAEPIVFDEKDTEVQREMKAGVIELREELKKRGARGEDIEKVMEDTRNQLKELSLYRQELEDEVKRLSTSDLTQKDYEELISSANEMLAERGIKPLALPTSLKRTIRLRQVQEEAKKKKEIKK